MRKSHLMYLETEHVSCMEGIPSIKINWTKDREMPSSGISSGVAPAHTAGRGVQICDFWYSASDANSEWTTLPFCTDPNSQPWKAAWPILHLVPQTWKAHIHDKESSPGAQAGSRRSFLEGNALYVKEVLVVRTVDEGFWRHEGFQYHCGSMHHLSLAGGKAGVRG